MDDQSFNPIKVQLEKDLAASDPLAGIAFGVELLIQYAAVACQPTPLLNHRQRLAAWSLVLVSRAPSISRASAAT
jgi:hypothetical protein